jgi:hypothetical protein
MTRDLDQILRAYQSSFSAKVFTEIDGGGDVLMDAFSITNQMKSKNKQYWGRELGKCWEKLTISIFEDLDGFTKGIKVGQDEICDLVYNNYAIDTKYRVGSGDSGTLKKFKQYGAQIKGLKKTPVMLFLREDNLPAAITAMKKGGWEIITGEGSFAFIKEHSSFDLEDYLKNNQGEFSVL